METRNGERKNMRVIWFGPITTFLVYDQVCV